METMEIQGDKGDEGDKGDKGDKVDKGDEGDKGDQGDKGDKVDKPRRLKGRQYAALARVQLPAPALHPSTRCRRFNPFTETAVASST